MGTMNYALTNPNSPLMRALDQIMRNDNIEIRWEARPDLNMVQLIAKMRRHDGNEIFVQQTVPPYLDDKGVLNVVKYAVELLREENDRLMVEELGSEENPLWPNAAIASAMESDSGQMALLEALTTDAGASMDGKQAGSGD